MAAKSSTGVLAKLRALMKNTNYVTEPLNAYIIPTGDAHQSEYVAECDERRVFMTGFTGSAGTAVVTETEAALFTDGRYFIQAEKQMDENWKLMKEGLAGVPSMAEWLDKTLPVAGRVGTDPMLLSGERWKPLARELKGFGHALVPVTQNLVDLIWTDRPAPPANPITVLPDSFTGASWQTKVKDVRKAMTDAKAAALVITALDEIAWLFNLRGSDIIYNPVFFAYAVVTMDSIHLFLGEGRMDKAVKQHLEVNGTGGAEGVGGVEVLPYSDISTFLACLAETNESKIWICPKSSFALRSIVPKHNLISQPSPVAALKAIKNETEVKGMKRAQVKDAVALCEFFQWLEKEVPSGTVTEVSAAQKLENFRKEQKEFVSPSFDTISSVGAHGSIIHYKPDEESDVPLTTDQIYLCDSGGQYRDGTTDTTRTIHLGTPSKHEQESFTRVLKGHIQLATLVFPNGITGHQIDVLARTPLWEVGLEYMHGTGHGVGSYLNVHEGPCGISPRPSAQTPLKAGMILSNEPGYYEDGQFGVRIESLILVKPAQTKHNFKDKGFLTFETITPVPLQAKMIDPSLLTPKELEWVNAFHAWCREVVGEELRHQNKTNVMDWLVRNTEPLG